MSMDPTTAAMAAAYGYTGTIPTTQFAHGIDAHQPAHGLDAHQPSNEVRNSYIVHAQ